MIKQIPSPNFSSRDGNSVKFICVHIMDGTLAGTDSWFASPVSQVSSHYGIGLAGEIHQYVQEENMAWTNGIVNQPTAKVILDNLGINPNKLSVTIENEGTDLNNGTEIQLATLAQLIHDLCTKYKLPIDRYHIIGHQEVDQVKKPNCPSYDRTFMDRLVQRVLNLQPTNNNQKTVELAKQIISLNS